MKYEHCAYKDFKKRAPSRGTEVDTPLGKGVVIDHNVPKERLLVEFETGGRQEVPLTDVAKVSNKKK